MSPVFFSKSLVRFAMLEISWPLVWSTIFLNDPCWLFCMSSRFWLRILIDLNMLLFSCSISLWTILGTRLPSSNLSFWCGLSLLAWWLIKSMLLTTYPSNKNILFGLSQVSIKTLELNWFYAMWYIQQMVQKLTPIHVDAQTNLIRMGFFDCFAFTPSWQKNDMFFSSCICHKAKGRIKIKYPAMG